MIKLLIFDKDGVILDLAASWLPVVRAIADYTISCLPADYHGPLTRAELLGAIGVDDATDMIDMKGMFAAATFSEILKKWQEMLPNNMIRLDEDETYQEAINDLNLELAHGNAVAKGDVKTPLTALHAAGYKLALLTNDDTDSAKQNLVDLGIDHLFDPIMGADAGFGGKPSPKGLLHCCEVNDVSPAETIMIGDTGTDYGVATNGKTADFIAVVDDPAHRPDPSIPVGNVIARLTALPALMAARSDTA